MLIPLYLIDSQIFTFFASCSFGYIKQIQIILTLVFKSLHCKWSRNKI